MKHRTASRVDRYLLQELEAVAPGAVQEHVDLSQITRWRIGGYADAVVDPANEQEVAGVIRVLSESSVPYCVIGETSNLLFDSEGLRGVIVRVASRLSAIDVNGLDVRVQAGTPVPRLARAVGALGLTDIEHTVGIPGTIGGLVLMNGGSQRKGIGSNVTWVRYVEANGRIRKLSQHDCRFAYRTSSLQGYRGVVVEVGLRLNPGRRDAIEAEMDAIVASRKARFPENQPNCGSTFVSNPAMYESVGPPGKAIERAGLKGLRVGGAQIALAHANFINNIGGATSEDVLELIGLARDAVLERTGFEMEAEVRYVSTDGVVSPAHEVTDIRKHGKGS